MSIAMQKMYQKCYQAAKKRGCISCGNSPWGWQYPQRWKILPPVSVVEKWSVPSVRLPVSTVRSEPFDSQSHNLAQGLTLMTFQWIWSYVKDQGHAVKNVMFPIWLECDVHNQYALSPKCVLALGSFPRKAEIRISETHRKRSIIHCGKLIPTHGHACLSNWCLLDTLKISWT